MAKKDVLKETVKAVETINDEIASMTGAHMAKVKAKREEIKDIYDDAKNAGLSTKALKAMVKARELMRKALGRREALDGDDMSYYDDYVERTGSWDKTPLGQAMAEVTPGVPDSAANVVPINPNADEYEGEQASA